MDSLCDAIRYFERYNIYMTIFKEFTGKQKLQPSDFRRLFVSYLESKLEPAGWNATWNLSREWCKRLGIDFPSPLVDVWVIQVNYQELNAEVKIGRDSYVKFPSKVLSEVPLIDLSVAIEQENTSIDFIPTAECLYHFRYFYNNLWRPWDEDKGGIGNESKIQQENVGNEENWISVYLDVRMRILSESHFDDAPLILKTILNCVMDGRRLYSLMEHLDKKEVSEEQTTDYVKEFLTTKCRVAALEEAHLKRIKSPSLENQIKSGANIVMKTCSLETREKYFSDPIFTGDVLIKNVGNNLQDVMSNAVPFDAVIICDGSYLLHNIGFLRMGGHLRGLYENNKPVIEDANIDYVWLDFYGSFTLIEHVVLNVRHCTEGIVVFEKATVTMTEVSLRGIRDVGMQAIAVCEGATLRCEGCDFSGFNVAVVCMPGSSVCLVNCIFENNETHVKVFPEAKMHVEYTESWSKGNRTLDTFQKDAKGIKWFN